ncbi:hypothetical protein NECAME_06682 [Necator americanus]|uniref:Uncharacterized protein n=1 Tax=Necator americanus TaxID=51031 RepID=W2TSS7_NECAM|nr:hypothetical protein NECAME_06682 [Necator americanus]ETN84798.1 hypothetical protein NECAME_06682 [Necator americanus]
MKEGMPSKDKYIMAQTKKKTNIVVDLIITFSSGFFFLRRIPEYNGVEGQALREEALAAIELVADRLEDHFGWTECTRVPAGQPRLGPAPLFTFEVHHTEGKLILL